MLAHTLAWEQLSHVERRCFEQEALQRRAHVRNQIEAKRADILEDIAAIEGGVEAQARRRGLPNHLSSCRLSQKELARFVERLAESKGAAGAFLEL